MTRRSGSNTSAARLSGRRRADPTPASGRGVGASLMVVREARFRLAIAGWHGGARALAGLRRWLLGLAACSPVESYRVLTRCQPQRPRSGDIARSPEPGRRRGDGLPEPRDRAAAADPRDDHRRAAEADPKPDRRPDANAAGRAATRRLPPLGAAPDCRHRLPDQPRRADAGAAAAATEPPMRRLRRPPTHPRPPPRCRRAAPAASRRRRRLTAAAGWRSSARRRRAAEAAARPHASPEMPLRSAPEPADARSPADCRRVAGGPALHAARRRGPLDGGRTPVPPAAGPGIRRAAGRRPRRANRAAEAARPPPTAGRGHASSARHAAPHRRRCRARRSSAVAALYKQRAASR